MSYDQFGNKIVSSGEDGFVTIDFSRLTGGWTEATSNEVQKSNRNDNVATLVEEKVDWDKFAHNLPEQTEELPPPVDLRRKKRVLDVVENMDIVDEAKQFRIDRDKPPFDEPEVFDGFDFLEQDESPVAYKIADLWPEGSNVLFAAPAKFGKSTMMMNMVRSLLTGLPFLGEFAVEQPMAVDESLLLIDLEMNPDRVRAELRAHVATLPQEKRRILKVACLRGQAKQFDITDAEVRAYWVKNCRDNNVTTLILDPLAPLLGLLNIDENDNTMVNRLFQQLDEFKLEAGIKDMIVVHHCGHMADYRPRGASRFNDWPDALWGAKLTDPNDPVNTTRTFHARGRDVGENMGGPGEIKRDLTNLKVLHFVRGTSGANQADSDAMNTLANHIYSKSGQSTDQIIEWATGEDKNGNVTGTKNIDFGKGKIRDLLDDMFKAGPVHRCAYKMPGDPGKGTPPLRYAADIGKCGKTPPCQPPAD